MEAERPGRAAGLHLLAALLAADLWFNAVRFLLPAECLPWLQPTLTVWLLAQITALAGYLEFGNWPFFKRLSVAVVVLLGAVECCYLYAPYWPPVSFGVLLLRAGGLLLLTAGWLHVTRSLGLRLATAKHRQEFTGSPFCFSLTQYFAAMTAWAVLLAFSRSHWTGVWSAANSWPWLVVLSLLGAATIVATLCARSLGNLAKGLVLAMVLAPAVAGSAIGIGVAVLFVYCGLVSVLTSVIWHTGWRGAWTDSEPLRATPSFDFLTRSPRSTFNLKP